MTLDAAYAACAHLARTHYENFPVASHLLPRRMRPHVAAVYAFARLADDIADEGDAPLDLRNARLDEWLTRLDAAVHGQEPPSATVLDPAMAQAAPAIFFALGATMRECELPSALFQDLVSAFRQDTTVTRYDTWPDVFDYCRRSANPVGRLVLRIGGWRDRRARRGLRRGVHGAAAHQLLAGPGRRLDARPAVRPRAQDTNARGR